MQKANPNSSAHQQLARQHGAWGTSADVSADAARQSVSWSAATVAYQSGSHLAATLAYESEGHLAATVGSDSVTAAWPGETQSSWLAAKEAAVAWHG